MHDVLLLTESKVQSVQLAVLALHARHVFVLSSTNDGWQRLQSTPEVTLL